MKGERMAKRSSFGSIVRKKLSDITNAHPQQKSLINLDTPPCSSSDKENITHLLKENVALVKLIQDKNKIIELSGVELQKMRVSLQKLQLQNWNLAQSNSHMLAELNLGKEKLKSLQHDVVCKEALLKAKILEAKEQEGTNFQSLKDGDAATGVCRANEDQTNTNSTRKHHRAIRSRSMGHSTSSQQVTQQEAAENKRRCVRRKSASVRMKQQEEPEDLFELDDSNLETSRIIDSPARMNGSSVSKSPMINQAKDGRQDFGFRSSRASLGRPLRKAAEKVQSYKEIPVNVKMRRPE